MKPANYRSRRPVLRGSTAEGGRESAHLNPCAEHKRSSRDFSCTVQLASRLTAILPLLSAFALSFGAIASKRSEDGGERAGARANVSTHKILS